MAETEGTAVKEEEAKEEAEEKISPTVRKRPERPKVGAALLLITIIAEWEQITQSELRTIHKIDSHYGINSSSLILINLN